jgi:hypothetical protein
MAEKIVINLTEYVMTTRLTSVYLYERESTPDFLLRFGTFAASQLINSSYFDKKKVFLRIFDKSEDNRILQQYIFSVLLQTAADSYFTDNRNIIVEDILDISIIYAANYIRQNLPAISGDSEKLLLV